jgi:hypothetical protein
MIGTGEVFIQAITIRIKRSDVVCFFNLVIDYEARHFASCQL